MENGIEKRASASEARKESMKLADATINPTRSMLGPGPTVSTRKPAGIPVYM